MSRLHLVFVFLCFLNVWCAVNKGSAEDGFKECLVTHQNGGSLGYCIGYGALAKLRSYDSSPEFDLVDGLTFTRDEQMYREGYPNIFEQSDPNSFSSITDSFGQVFSRRNMQWNMDFVHPGLSLRVAPSGLAGGVLEFIMDPIKEAAFSQHSLKEASTGRILTRQFLVPLLLGFKFNIATLLPIIFGLIALMAKKAAFLSKIVLVITSAFSIGSLLFGSNGPAYGYGGGGYHQPPFNPGFGGHHHYRYPTEEEYQESSYRGNNGNNANTNGYGEDQLRLYDGELQQIYSNREDIKKGRNFAWSDDEKKKQKN